MGHQSTSGCRPLRPLAPDDLPVGGARRTPADNARWKSSARDFE